MPSGAPRRRRARPVADAPVDALLLRVEDLAKGWLLAVLEDAPLEAAPAILAADLAREGPRICDAVVRALADDRDLRRLEPNGALEPLVARVGELSGAEAAEATGRAVDALSAVVWSAVRAELAGPDPDQITEIAERLALIAEVIRAAALRRHESVRSGPGPSLASAGPAAASPGPGVVIAGPAVASTGRADPSPAPAPEPEERSGGGSGPSPSEASPGPHALWVDAVSDEIGRSERAGLPLSLLLVELEDAERIRAVEELSDLQITMGRFVQALRSVVRRGDILACETASRAWVIARETARPGARALAERIADAVRSADAWRGAPLSVAVGLAVLGEDGRDVEELIEAAEEARFDAEASGTAVGRSTRYDED